MAIDASGPIRRLTEWALNMTGFVLLFSLPGIWVSWTPAVLLGVVSAGLMAAVLHCLLSRVDDSGGAGSSSRSAPPRARHLDERTLADLSALHPFVHHHSATPQYRTVMRRLRRDLTERS